VAVIATGEEKKDTRRHGKLGQSANLHGIQNNFGATGEYRGPNADVVSRSRRVQRR